MVCDNTPTDSDDSAEDEFLHPGDTAHLMDRIRLHQGHDLTDAWHRTQAAEERRLMHLGGLDAVPLQISAQGGFVIDQSESHRHAFADRRSGKRSTVPWWSAAVIFSWLQLASAWITPPAADVADELFSLMDRSAMM
jgi:hypothetical protein